MSSQTRSNGVLAYASPRAKNSLRMDYASRRGAKLPNPITATVLHLPGLYCWIVYFCLLSHASIPRRMFDAVAALTLLVWPLAFIMAIVSMFLYLGARRRPWYVWINLAVNISGVVFTLLALLFGNFLLHG